MHNILIVEDHPMMVDAIKASVQGLLFKTRIYAVSSLSELQTDERVQAAGAFSLIVADLNLSDSEGLVTFYALRARYPLVEILVFSQINDPRIEAQLLRLGVAGYVAKSNQPKMLIQHMNRVLEKLHKAGSIEDQIECHDSKHQEAEPAPSLVESLTRQQRKVLKLAASGHSSVEIASRLGVSEPTVRTHLTEVYRRLKVKNRAQAIVLYFHWTSLN
jgi:DNA-binding NarL/FixJ family response regulator